jgi:hypothetical protein
MNKHHKSSAAAKPAKPNINVWPLVVSTAEAGRMGGTGKTKTFALIKSGEYASFLDGRVRRVLVASIEARVERKLREAQEQTA